METKTATRGRPVHRLRQQKGGIDRAFVDILAVEGKNEIDTGVAAAGGGLFVGVERGRGCAGETVAVVGFGLRADVAVEIADGVGRRTG